MVHITDWLPTLIRVAGGDLNDYPELQDIDGTDQVICTLNIANFYSTQMFSYGQCHQYETLFLGSDASRKAFVYNLREETVGPDNVTAVVGAIRYGQWKLINADERDFPLEPVGTFRLYNLMNDPNETTDVFQTEPEVASKMVTKFQVLNNQRIVLPLSVKHST